MAEQWLIASEAAEAVGVSRRTMQAWLRAGKVAGARQGKSGLWLIPASSLSSLSRGPGGRPTHRQCDERLGEAGGEAD